MTSTRRRWATVGTVGPPGQRTFYLQARQDDQLITLKLEKQWRLRNRPSRVTFHPSNSR